MFRDISLFNFSYTREVAGRVSVVFSRLQTRVPKKRRDTSDPCSHPSIPTSLLRRSWIGLSFISRGRFRALPFPRNLRCHIHTARPLWNPKHLPKKHCGCILRLLASWKSVKNRSVLCCLLWEKKREKEHFHVLFLSFLCLCFFFFLFPTWGCSDAIVPTQGLEEETFGLLLLPRDDSPTFVLQEAQCNV